MIAFGSSSKLAFLAASLYISNSFVAEKSISFWLSSSLSYSLVDGSSFLCFGDVGTPFGVL